jgi:hypothetical protein
MAVSTADKNEAMESKEDVEWVRKELCSMHFLGIFYHNNWILHLLPIIVSYIVAKIVTNY